MDGRRAEAGRAYLEFFRIPRLSIGIYVLRTGELDKQQPHTEDELYYVVAGRGMVRVEDEDRSVKPGTVIFVPATVDHRFHTIAEDLTLLVLFTPAERTDPTGLRRREK